MMSKNYAAVIAEGRYFDEWLCLLLYGTFVLQVVQDWQDLLLTDLSPRIFKRHRTVKNQMRFG